MVLTRRKFLPMLLVFCFMFSGFNMFIGESLVVKSYADVAKKTTIDYTKGTQTQTFLTNILSFLVGGLDPVARIIGLLLVLLACFNVFKKLKGDGQGSWAMIAIMFFVGGLLLSVGLIGITKYAKGFGDTSKSDFKVGEGSNVIDFDSKE